MSEKMIKPKMVTVISRKLKKGVTFEEFHRKWQPDVKDKTSYFSFPVQIIHLANISDPTEIVSIGLLDATEEMLFEEGKRIAFNEKERSKKISPVCEPTSDTKLYHVVKIDTLGS